MTRLHWLWLGRIAGTTAPEPEPPETTWGVTRGNTFVSRDPDSAYSSRRRTHTFEHMDHHTS